METKEPKPVHWLAFRVEYEVTESGGYPSPQHPDHLGGTPLYTLWPQRPRRPVWFIDKVRVESVISRVAVFLDLGCWDGYHPHTSSFHVLLSSCESRTDSEITGIGGL